MLLAGPGLSVDVESSVCGSGINAGKSIHTVALHSLYFVLLLLL